MSEDPTPYQHETKLSAEQRRVLERADKLGLIYEGDDAICGGIHFCPDWDGMAVCADSPEADGCHCGRLRPKASTLSEDEVGAPAPCEVSHNDGKPLDTSGKSLGLIAFLEHHMRGFPPFTEEEAHLFWGELEERERQEWEAAAQAVRLHVLEEAAKEWRDAVQHFSVAINAVAMTSSSEELRSFIAALPDTFPVPKSCVTDADMQAAIEKAHCIRPQIEAEKAEKGWK